MAAIARPSLRIRRLFLLLVVALAVAPGTWVRFPSRGVLDDRQILVFDRLAVPDVALGEGIEVAGAWHLTSPNYHFSGFSGLVPMGDGTLLATSDIGRQMRFAPPGAARLSVKFDYFSAPTRQNDLEAITRDPVTGNLWGAFERTNFIERYDAGLRITGNVRPREMRNWPSNEGAEAFARLADGRFIVLSEGSSRWFASELPGLLFPGDPVESVKPVMFRFQPPEDFVPVDMTQLPDGRVLILLRSVRWRLPPRFEGKLVVADPAEIQPGKLWSGREIAQLSPPLPMDNYEGLAVEAGEDGRLALWLISDDNKSRFQRTLLLKLLWRPNE